VRWKIKKLWVKYKGFGEMSESDRIRYKRIATELKAASFNPVFDSGDYTEFKSFNLVNAVKNTNLEVDDLDKSNKRVLNYFDVKMNNVLDASGNTICPNYLCNPYSMWPNRVPLGGIYSRPQPQTYFYWDNFTVCFGSIQGASITSLPNNRNARKTGTIIEICDTQKIIKTYQY
jgi:hypothetical protein